MRKILLCTAMLFAFGANAQFRLVKDIIPGANNSLPGNFFEYNGRLFFDAYSGSSTKYYIYATDGTTVGTSEISYGAFPNAINAPRQNIGYYEYNSDLYFDASTTSGIVNIVKLTGTSNNAIPLYRIESATFNPQSRFRNAALINDKFIFNPALHNTSAFALEPIVFNLLNTPSSGYLNNINPAVNGSGIDSNEKFIALGTNCFFGANDGTNGKELWKTDGTNAGTTLYLDMNTGAPDSNPNQLTVLGGQLTFVATHPTLGRELFKTNGSGSLVLIKDINTSGDSNPTNVTAIGGILYFSANNGSIGNELWKSNGNSLGTVLVKDINPTGDSNPSNFTLLGTDVYFTANSTATGVDLWKTDGTNAGTVLVRTITVTGGIINNLTAYNSKLYFATRPTNNLDRLWSSDGTMAGTTELLANAQIGEAELIVFNNELYMSLNSNVVIGDELYAYMDPALSTTDFQLNQNAIKLFPNPSKNYFELTTELTIEKVEVYSILGQLVKTYEEQGQYEISKLAKGSYIVKINTPEGILNKTLIIE
jgi:ELWxxDGT repeat protein